MVKPRVYLLCLIVAAYSFIPSYRIIPCLILSSLPLSNYRAISFTVRYHLLVSQSFIYYFIVCAHLCINPFATHVPVESVLSSFSTLKQKELWFQHTPSLLNTVVGQIS